MPTAKTEVSDDGQALVVHRFDVDERGQPHWGMEDFCSLLGLRPAAKYDTTWERIAKAVRDHVPVERRLDTFRQLATTLLLTYALRNADCHAKNLALLYTCRADVHLSPAYDMLTTSVYAGFQHNPPGIEFMGKKTWTPGKNLQKFIAANFGIQPKEQAQMVEAISDAVADVGNKVREAMAEHGAFNDIGKRMLTAWSDGVQGCGTNACMPLVSGHLAMHLKVFRLHPRSKVNERDGALPTTGKALGCVFPALGKEQDCDPAISGV